MQRQCVRQEQLRCVRCGGFHLTETRLEDKAHQCSNCGGSHEARSTECMEKVKQIAKVRVGQGVTYAKAVRRVDGRECALSLCYRRAKGNSEFSHFSVWTSETVR